MHIPAVPMVPATIWDMLTQNSGALLPVLTAVSVIMALMIQYIPVFPGMHNTLLRRYQESKVLTATKNGELWLTVRAVRVSDGDTLRVVHVPALRSAEKVVNAALESSARSKRKTSPSKKSQQKQQQHQHQDEDEDDKEQVQKQENYVLQFRLAGVDCPETAHFGTKAQPLADVATEFTRARVLPTVKSRGEKRNIYGPKLRVRILSTDQYGRSVGLLYYRPWPRLLPLYWSNLSLDLVKKGLGVVYRGGGAVYGDCLDELTAAEKDAKAKRRGLWKLKDFVPPSQHKREGKRNSEQSSPQRSRYQKSKPA